MKPIKIKFYVTFLCHILYPIWYVLLTSNFNLYNYLTIWIISHCLYDHAYSHQTWCKSSLLSLYTSLSTLLIIDAQCRCDIVICGTVTLFLTRLFSKKALRYCYSPVVSVICVIEQKFWHFLISLLLLKIFTWNSDKLLNINRGAHSNRGGGEGAILNFSDVIMSLFRLRIFWKQLQPSVGTRMWCSCFL